MCVAAGSSAFLTAQIIVGVSKNKGKLASILVINGNSLTT